MSIYYGQCSQQTHLIVKTYKHVRESAIYRWAWSRKNTVNGQWHPCLLKLRQMAPLGYKALPVNKTGHGPQTGFP